MRNKIWFVCLSLLMLLSGCYEDKGNYSYAGLAKYIIDSNSLSSSGSLTLTQGETLTIDPVITNEQGDTLGDLPNLEYTWKINHEKVIGNEKKLTYVCNELFDVVVLALVVRDKETELEFSESVSLSVTQKFGDSGSFYVLGVKDGKTCLSLVRGSSIGNSNIDIEDIDINSLVGVYYAENNEYLPDDPIRIHEHKWVDMGSREQPSALIITPTELVDIEGGTLLKDVTGTEMFGGTWPAGLRVANVMYMGWIDLLEDEHGQIYTRIKQTNKLPNSEYFYTVPAKCEGEEALTDTHLIISKFDGDYILLDDKKNKRILYTSDRKSDSMGEYALGRIHAIRTMNWPEGFVPLDNYEGYNLVHCGYYDIFNDYSGNGGVGKNFLFIFEKNGEYTVQACTIYQDSYNSSTLTVSNMNVLSVDKSTGLHKELLAPIMNGNNCIYTLPYTTQATNPGSYTFISSGNDLYMYDRNANVVKKYLTFDAPVTAMDGEWYNSNYMAVGLENGKFYLLEMKNAKNLADDKKIVWESSDDLGRIVSIRYKNAQGWIPNMF